jgi:DNA repair protein RadC
MGIPTEQEVKSALEEAGRMRERGADPHHLAKVLLNQHQRLTRLEKVLHTAEWYMHSGHGSTEHARLLRAIEAAKTAERDANASDELDYGL